MTSLFLPLKRTSMEQRPGAAHEGGVHYSVCVCVFSAATEAFSLKVITCENHPLGPCSSL